MKLHLGSYLNNLKTNEVIEYLLYYRANKESIRECLEIAKLDLDFPLIPKPHLELEFIERFKNPKFLIIVDKLMYVYIFGEKSGSNIHYLEIIGNETTYNIQRVESVRKRILKRLREDFYLYLPLSFYRKVIYIEPKTDTLTDDDILCVTRNELTKPMTTQTTWHTKKETYSANRDGFNLYFEELLTRILREL